MLPVSGSFHVATRTRLTSANFNARNKIDISTKDVISTLDESKDEEGRKEIYRRLPTIQVHRRFSINFSLGG